MSVLISALPSIEIGPFTRAQGSIVLPGSKSISNRALLLAALSSGQTTLTNLLDADDTQVMRNALRTLGLSVIDQPNNVCIVNGCGGQFPVREADLFMGNAGTAIRPLTAALAMQGGNYRLSGVARMHERPIRDLVDGLRQVGADIAYELQEGYPPIQISSANIQIKDVVKVRGDVSSQFLTALLMALPLVATEPVRIEVIGELISRPYIEITLKLMSRFGVNVACPDAQSFVISKKTSDAVYKSPGQLSVEGDASSASYFLALGAIGGGPVRVLGVGKDSIQGDVAFADALALMGADITAGEDWIEVSGAKNADGKLKGITIDCTEIPDAAMTLAVAALFADGETRLNGIASWRVKETDRIAAMAKELKKVGAIVEEGADYIVVSAPKKLDDWRSPSEGIDTYDDHRMAMCFSLVALGPNTLKINDPNCVAKTFPTLGLYVHNDVVVAFGQPEKQILVEPVFAQWIQASSGKALYGFDVLLSSSGSLASNASNNIWLPGWLSAINDGKNSLFLPIGPGDFLVHHAIALALHTTTLILVKGALDARGSKLMPDKKDFGYSFPCDGPGRGGTCDISAWDAFYLSMFWMLNTIGWVTFYWHWKHVTIWQGNPGQFNESSTYIMGWLRDYLWLNSSPLINGYNPYGMNSLSVWSWMFLFGHLIWATGFMFLISWRGYWQELIETLAWAHERTPLANLVRWKDKPVALSIVQARLVGLIHFTVGYIFTYAAFVIASTTGKFG